MRLTTSLPTQIYPHASKNYIKQKYNLIQTLNLTIIYILFNIKIE